MSLVVSGWWLRIYAHTSQPLALKRTTHPISFLVGHCAVVPVLAMVVSVSQQRPQGAACCFLPVVAQPGWRGRHAPCGFLSRAVQRSERYHVRQTAARMGLMPWAVVVGTAADRIWHTQVVHPHHWIVPRRIRAISVNPEGPASNY